MATIADQPRTQGRHRGKAQLSPTPPLPTPPTAKERAGYADRGMLLISCSSLMSFGALMLSQIRFVFLSPVLVLIFLPLLALTLAQYFLAMYVDAGTTGFDQPTHRRLVDSWRPDHYPSLDVFLPVCGEPLAVLNNTWVYVADLARAHRGRATVYVLDDGASEDVRVMAAGFGFTYLRRPNRGWMKKAGNLRHAFACTSGEFILILDADFAPSADLPAQMLPYFSADPSLGIVQSPQFFRTRKGMSWMERGAGAVQELFYRLMQVSRDRHNGAICVGSCAVYRRAALAVNGGTTPIEHSEDVHTGFDLRSHGWGLRYIPVPVSTGLCPSDPDSFLTQQYRWCTGSMSLLGSRKFWATRMRWRTRCCYLSGFCYYLQTAMFTFVAPLIPLIMLIVMPDHVRLANYVFIVPSVAYNLIIFPAWHRCSFGLEALMAKLLYGWAHLYALWDICRRRQMGWQATGGGKRKAGTRRIWVGLAVWTGGTSLAWMALGIWRMTSYGLAIVPLLATGLLSCVITGMALASRRNHARVSREANRLDQPIKPISVGTWD